jgi:uncharacterized integral membrane protein
MTAPNPVAAQTPAAALHPDIARDRVIYRFIVFVLGALALLVAIVASTLVFLRPEAEVPDVLVSLGSAAVGALAGLLAPSPVSAT